MTWLRYACSSAWWGWIAHPSDIFQAHNVRPISHDKSQQCYPANHGKPWQTSHLDPSWMCLWILLRMTSGLSTKKTCEHTIVTIKSWGRFNMASPPTSTNHCNTQSPIRRRCTDWYPPGPSLAIQGPVAWKMLQPRELTTILGDYFMEYAWGCFMGLHHQRFCETSKASLCCSSIISHKTIVFTLW